MAYIGTSPQSGVRRRYLYTATAGQTSFSGNDSNGISLVYVDSEYLDVYQNGVKLKTVSDYASTTGTTVVLVSAAALNDIVEIIAHDIVGIADTVSAADGGNFGGNVGMGGTLAVTGVPTFTGRSVHSGGITVANDGQIGSVGDADAIAISSSGVVTFSQAPVGAGMDLLLDTTISSAVAQFDITSTHINSTHDSYFIYADLLPATDNVFLKTQVFVGGSIQTGDIYGSEAAAKSSSSYFNDNDTSHFKMSVTNVGNAAGEGGTWWLNLHNVNKTDKGFCYAGDVHMYATGAQPTAVTIGGALIVANRANVVNGYRLFFSSGNIASGVVRVYGIRT